MGGPALLTVFFKKCRTARRKNLIPAAGTALLVWLAALAAPAMAADFSGIWMPRADLDAPLQADKLPLTHKAKEAVTSFDSRRQDSTRYCMPYGTPRNTLGTAPYPIEILQTPERLTIIFDRLGDVRRVFLDGRERPKNLWPTWLGHSLGRWNKDTLSIETRAMTSESILSDQGLPHSDDMEISEKLSLVKRGGTELLQDQITITDPATYSVPIKTVRYFERAPLDRMSEGSGLCLLDQWRKRLETRNRDLALRAGVTDEAGSEGGGQ